MSVTTRTIELAYDGEGSEVTVDIDYQFHRAVRGARERGGLQVEPDEPAHVEVNAVWFSGENADDVRTDIDIYPVLGKDILAALAADILADELSPREPDMEPCK
jgi:hypothetical protein